MDRKQNRQKWTEIISTQESSGMHQKSWCEANNINIHNFRYWKRRLKEMKYISETTESLWVALTQGSSTVANEGSLSVKVGNAHIEVNGSTCMLTLEKVLQVLMKHAS